MERRPSCLSLDRKWTQVQHEPVGQPGTALDDRIDAARQQERVAQGCVAIDVGLFRIEQQGARERLALGFEINPRREAFEFAAACVGTAEVGHHRRQILRPVDRRLRGRIGDRGFGTRHLGRGVGLPHDCRKRILSRNFRTRLARQSRVRDGYQRSIRRSGLRRSNRRRGQRGGNQQRGAKRNQQSSRLRAVNRRNTDAITRGILPLAPVVIPRLAWHRSALWCQNGCPPLLLLQEVSRA